MYEFLPRLAQVTMLVEALCLAYYIARTVHHRHWRRNRDFFRDLKNKIIIGIIGVRRLI